LQEPVRCRGINGSITLSKDNLHIIGGGLGSIEAHEIPFSQVSAVVVQRKSVVPFATLTILAVVVVLISKYNALWFVIDLSRTGLLITPIAVGVAILCAIPTVLRLNFVNVSIRSSGSLLTVRLVPIRSARKLARSFSEMSAGS
jgi:hypothetical protein